MMNHDKWINTLPGKNYNINNSKQELDPQMQAECNAFKKKGYLKIIIVR